MVEMNKRIYTGPTVDIEEIQSFVILAGSTLRIVKSNPEVDIHYNGGGSGPARARGRNSNDVEDDLTDELNTDWENL